MNYITLDTNTWIYLANGTEPVRILNYIIEETKKGNIKILLPKIIIEEWEQNKDKHVRQGSLKHFKDIQSQLSRLKKLVDTNKNGDFLFDENNLEKDDNDSLIDFIEKFNKKRQSVENAVKKNISIIDDLFKNDITIIDIKQEIILKSAECALAKKAPFLFKNSFADALIIFSLLDYLEENKIQGAKFISYNTKDFCKTINDEANLHPDLVPEFQRCNCEFHKIVSLAIKEIEEDIISKEELEYIEELQNEWDDDFDPDGELCPVCSEAHDRLGTVSFYSEPLIDLRTNIPLNENQLELEFDEKYPKSPRSCSIEVGECDYCSTNYIVCVDCSQMSELDESDYNKPFECQGCGLVYFIDYTYHHNGSEWKDYTIPETTYNCEKCGEEFERGLMIENLCKNCEDDYSYK